MHLRLSYLFKIFGYVFCLLVFAQVILQVYLEMFETDLFEDLQHAQLNPSYVRDPVVLWWVPFTGEPGSIRQCGDIRCYVTEDRNYFHHTLIRAIIFYGSKLDILDLPLPRKSSELIWALLHEESPKNVPALSHEAVLSLFNFSSTFSRHSDVPLTLQYLKSFESLTSIKYFMSTAEKDKLLGELAPVLYIQSSCNAPSGRDSYVQELGKHIKIDSYGKCLQNKKLPEHIQNHSEGEDSEDFMKFVAPYKFTLALENAICEDYITEKLWRPLVVGSVPIYMGSPSIRDWLPNNKSAILISDFKSPRDLARYLLDLNLDATAYEIHLQHKLAHGARRVDNERLLSALKSHPPEASWGQYVQRFECLVCKKLQGEMQPSSTVGRQQYDCPEPWSPLTGQPDKSAMWNEVWHTGRCEARLARSMVVRNKTYSHQEFSEQLLKLFQSGEC